MTTTVEKRKQANGYSLVTVDTAGTIRVDEIAAALQTLKDKRMEYAESCNSRLTSSLPQPQPSSPAHGAGSPAALVFDVQADDTQAASSSGGAPGASMNPNCTGADGNIPRGVRFADECGSELVTGVCQTTNWWNDMISGVYRCPGCGSEATSAVSRNWVEESAGYSRCDGCGALYRVLPPGELPRFIEELSNGVEATLLEPALIGKKSRRVLLYTEDDGESICWLETGGKRGSEPYCVPCKTLMEVKDCTRLATKGMPRVGSVDSRSQSHQPSVSTKSSTAKGGECEECSFSLAAALSQKSQDVEAAESSGKNRAAFNYQGVKNLGPASASMSGAFSLEEGALSRGNEKPEGGCICDDDASCGEGRGVRIKLRYRLTPTSSSLKKVTIVNVRSSCPAAFARGMVQLQEHNTDLLM